MLVDVHAAGVSFPEVLQTRGEYQIKPDLPFVPGSEVAGTVRSAPEARGSARAIASPPAACWAPSRTWPSRRTSSRSALSDELDYGQGAGLILNYHTAYFSLKHRGRRLEEGETVLVHGAAGGVGTAASRWRRGSARARSRWSRATRRSAWRARRARRGVVRSDGAWKDEAKELSGGGVDVVIDPVGGDRFTDSLGRYARAAWWSSASRAARSPRCG